jgi:hypothetical protein
MCRGRLPFFAAPWLEMEAYKHSKAKRKRREYKRVCSSDDPFRSAHGFGRRDAAFLFQSGEHVVRDPGVPSSVDERRGIRQNLSSNASTKSTTPKSAARK